MIPEENQVKAELFTPPTVFGEALADALNGSRTNARRA
jgi:hypothetical protein